MCMCVCACVHACMNVTVHEKTRYTGHFLANEAFKFNRTDNVCKQQNKNAENRIALFQTDLIFYLCLNIFILARSRTNISSLYT